MVTRHIRKTPEKMFCGRATLSLDPSTVRVGPTAATAGGQTCQRCYTGWEANVARRNRLLEAERQASYVDCQRAGCAVKVAPHDDHYHCPHCDSPRITGPYGHYESGYWRCPWDAQIKKGARR